MQKLAGSLAGIMPAARTCLAAAGGAGALLEATVAAAVAAAAVAAAAAAAVPTLLVEGVRRGTVFLPGEPATVFLIGLLAALRVLAPDFLLPSTSFRPTAPAMATPAATTPITRPLLELLEAAGVAALAWGAFRTVAGWAAGSSSYSLSLSLMVGDVCNLGKQCSGAGRHSHSHVHAPSSHPSPAEADPGAAQAQLCTLWCASYCPLLRGRQPEPSLERGEPLRDTRLPIALAPCFPVRGPCC